MGKLPGKILFSLILYAAGFATAIYLLVPSPVQAADQTQACETTDWSYDAQYATVNAGIASHQWVLKVRVGIDDCIQFAEEYALRAADFIRSNMGQGPQSN